VDGRLDLSEVNLTNLTISSGASTYDIRLGEKADRLASEINIGASTVNIHLPKSLGLKITYQTGASSNNFTNQGLTKSDDIYQTDNFDSAAKKIEITFKAGASSIELDRY
jgi:hypothetical protein